MTTIILSGTFTTWVVPADWNPNQNIIHAFGHGGSGLTGTAGQSGGGGGGGGYAYIRNANLIPGSTINAISSAAVDTSMQDNNGNVILRANSCLLYTSPSPRD